MSCNTAEGDAKRATDMQSKQSAEGSAKGGISDRKTAAAQRTDDRTDAMAGSGTRVDGYTTVDNTASTTADLEGLRVLGANDENLDENRGGSVDLNRS